MGHLMGHLTVSKGHKYAINIWFKAAKGILDKLTLYVTPQNNNFADFTAQYLHFSKRYVIVVTIR